jgi:hypothetical protein
MHSILRSLLTGVLVLAGVAAARAQSPPYQQMPQPLVDGGVAAFPGGPQPVPAAGVWSVPTPAAEEQVAQAGGAGRAMPPEQAMALLQQQIDALRQDQQLALQAQGQPEEQLRKRFELQQKQIETLEKMVRLLVEEIKRQPAGPAVQKLQTQTATLEARSVQAARRDREVAHGLDDLAEHLDADERNGPRLPATLKELFLPSRTNETPLSIYGTLVGGYQLFPSRRGEGEFFFDALEPIFLLQLNDHILLESELEFGAEGVDVGYAQMDYIVNDWLTIVFGRYLGPVGFFNERLHPDWINKLPDFPLMMRQVSLADFSLNGIQFRGGKYLFCSPVKMEYSVYLANGLGLPGEGSLTDLADLGALKDTTTDVNEAMAFGGRVGIGVPKWGVEVGTSTFFSRPYGEDVSPDISLWGIDLNYHKGNWDFRFEYAYMFEETTAFLDQNIRRRGLYAQVAYQPLDSSNHLLRKMAFVARYSLARFKGIDPAALDLTAFESPVDVPVDRNQYTFGIDFFPYPSLAFKFAVEINQELHGVDLKDNLFLAQVAWGF